MGGYHVRREDIEAAMAYAADLARETVIPFIPGAGLMRFKIDENLHEDVAEALRTHGHDAQTVFDEGLRGHADPEIAEVPAGSGASS